MHPLKVRKALGWMVLGLVVFNGFIVAGVFYYFSYLDSRSKDNRNNIVAIVQSCADRESLKTAFLVELLKLSVDQPTNIYRFNIAEARQRLLGCPVIKSAEIKKIKPGTLDIKYALRRPIAYLRDYTNAAIDEEGVLFPFKPFYTLKNLPEVIVGTQIDHGNGIWGTALNEADFELVRSLFNILMDPFSSDFGSLKSIDISQAFAESSGRREIVVVLEERLEVLSPGKKRLAYAVRTVRLPSDDFSQPLANYLVLRKHLNIQIDGSSTSHQIIDMRIPNLAFID